MFVFNGISSKDMEIIVEEENNFIAKARQRYNQTDIDGMDSAYFEELGYSPVDKTIKIQILNPKKIDNILAWLNGTGDLIFNNRITKVRFYNEIEPVRIANIFTADVNFSRNPFWNKYYDEFVTVNNLIINDGTVYSKPLIRLEKLDSEYIDLTINNIRFIYRFKDDSYVEIDCERKIEIYEGFNRSRQIEMGFQYPKLNPGENRVLINSGNATIKVKRKDRWL